MALHNKEYRLSELLQKLFRVTSLNKQKIITAIITNRGWGGIRFPEFYIMLFKMFSFQQKL